MYDLSIPYDELGDVSTPQGQRAQELFKRGHYGTHIDIHLNTMIPLDYANTEGVMFDVRHVGTSEVQLSDIDLNEVRLGDFVLFRTGMMEREGYATVNYFSDHTTLSDELIDALLARKVKIIGIDAVGVRRGNQHIDADKRCEQQGLYIIENLCQLEKLSTAPTQRLKFTTMWWPMPGQTGLPCRVIAQRLV